MILGFKINSAEQCPLGAGFDTHGIVDHETLLVPTFKGLFDWNIYTGKASLRPYVMLLKMDG